MCLCAALDDDDNADEGLFDFDEGDDLECDLAAALSSDDRKAADKNCPEFDEHVAQVSSSGLTVGPFRTPIEPCTSSSFNFNCSFGLCAALDKIWLITAVEVLDGMKKRFVRRWSGVLMNKLSLVWRSFCQC